LLSSCFFWIWSFELIVVSYTFLHQQGYSASLKCIFGEWGRKIPLHLPYKFVIVPASKNRKDSLQLWTEVASYTALTLTELYRNVSDRRPSERMGDERISGTNRCARGFQARGTTGDDVLNGCNHVRRSVMLDRHSRQHGISVFSVRKPAFVTPPPAMTKTHVSQMNRTARATDAPWMASSKRRTRPTGAEIQNV